MVGSLELGKTLSFGFLNKERSVAALKYNRWLVPPAAIAIQMSIGQLYAFSVFNLPLTRVAGGENRAAGDWTLATTGWIFSLAILCLGLTAAFTGKWLEEVGPRKAMFISALLFGGGFCVSALGIAWHQIALLYLGYGVIGGIGIGIAYISPVAALIKWFPDRPGMATGLSNMGFGGGAMIGSPLAIALMNHYAGRTSSGVAQTFVAMGLIYLAVMVAGALAIRLPAPGWQPRGYVAPTLGTATVTARNALVSEAVRTRQFYLLWAMLCLNVTAGIGVLGQASPMIQEMFPGIITPMAAAAFVGLLSVFNMAGRFVWAAASDHLGRRATYMIFFAAGMVLYALIPAVGHAKNIALFVIFNCLIFSMFGGGFAAMPAYLRDTFGTAHVGAIFGRLLTAWSVAGVLGPLAIIYLRQFQIAHGVAKADAYSITMYAMAGLLVLGLACNIAMHALEERRTAGRFEDEDVEVLEDLKEVSAAA